MRAPRFSVVPRHSDVVQESYVSVKFLRSYSQKLEDVMAEETSVLINN